MKKLTFVFVLCALLSVNYSAHSAEYKAALVADLNTGKVLYSENANELLYPASLTKIMTLYLTFDALEHGRLKLDDQLIVSQSAANASPVKLNLAAGAKISVEDAIKALAVYSANDVARVLAENLKGGKEGNFASLMTQVATEIGLSRTNFENSSGLPDDDQQSTARDIALLSMAVYKHFPQYWKYFSIKSWSYNGKTYTNGNRLLDSYPGADGMKTGYTNKSKYSLVATAHRGNAHVISVVLGAENKDVRASVSTRLLDKGFEQLGLIPFAGEGVARSDGVVVKNDLSATTPARVNSSATPSPAKGIAGVQFGAFGTRSAAAAHQLKVESALGVDTSVETAPNGMFRVRANGLSENAAQSMKMRASAVGIDSYVFH